jgi:hypothetical protein
MVDTKNWTWVLTERCPECGFEAGELPREQIGPRSREVAEAFAGFLGDAGARDRPAPEVWSTLEYGCHIRDVFRTMDGRLALMLDHDGAEFENWDQDATAVEDRYHAQDPAVVAQEVLAAGAAVADAFDRVKDVQWDHCGVRSNGSTFTVETLGQYLVHDLVHHVWDVERARAGAYS